MIESNNPEISVDSLMQKIREEVAIRHSKLDSSVASKSDFQALAINQTIAYIETLLKIAESRAYIRTNLPGKLKQFPLLLGKVQELILRVFNLLFRDQREVNLNLIRALRESVALNQQLGAELIVLKADAAKARERLNVLVHHLNQIDESYQKDYNSLKNDLLQQKHIISIPLEEAQRQESATLPQTPLETFIDAKDHSLDSFYIAFEDKFRGSRETIRDRLKVYLPLIEEAQVGTSESPILDVGCGRGEWLDLLQASGYVAQGIDINYVMLEQCKDKGLEVSEADVIQHLRLLPDNDLGAITGFHIIEHLPFEILLDVFQEAFRVLQPGGVAIFETPNPENVLVSSHTFYLDPTHRHPLPSALVQFVAEYSGFARVQVLQLHPYSEQIELGSNKLPEPLNGFFYGPQDYAIVGFKP